MLLEAWLGSAADADQVEPVEQAGMAWRGLPLLMTDLEATAPMARAALECAAELAR